MSNQNNDESLTEKIQDVISDEEVKKNYFLYKLYTDFMKKILIYNSGGGLGDSIQIIPLMEKMLLVV